MAGDGCGCGCGSADISTKIGYTLEDIAAVPEGANLGSGAGFDCFLAAARVEPGGRIIGIDMTP